MKTVTKEMFETTDGLVFDDQSQAMQHEARIACDASIVRYLASLEIDNDRTKTKMTNAILAWESFKATDNVRTVGTAATA